MTLLKVNTFLRSQLDSPKREPMTVEEVAMGFIKVANETMCRPIRALTQVNFKRRFPKNNIFIYPPQGEDIYWNLPQPAT
ncbi:hypothetical protein DPMN_178433 [Dreissena polymorpha]|uniref:Uncharacterized protein n=1 Tax=Dreissena polymorpha TaxID=45954 RepID=A0A9D4EDD5_DREPO|nr:hypothetical protein DPMN_178410 [Dreissena polymorpha]KAH3776999.1 hypothetical protein DPMN_178433 [Dreissena polymorpha]